MRYGKRTAAFALAAALTAVSACGGGSIVANNDTELEAYTLPEGEVTEETAAAETAKEETQPPGTSVTAPAEETAEDDEYPEGFRPGVWWCEGTSDGDHYYTFYEDGKSGHLDDQYYGIGVGFECEIDGSDCIFHLSPSGESRSGRIATKKSDTVRIKWDDGEDETWKYYCPESEFRFYSTTDLVEMAMSYYADRHDGNVPTQSEGSIEDDGRICIQLYDNASYSLNATAAWYFIDRFTAKGVDIDGREIDLSPYGEVNTAAQQPSDRDVFGTGVWWAKDAQRNDCYYFFDGKGGGSVLNQEMGIGVAFSYDIDGYDAVFHMASADVNDPVKISDVTDISMTLEWQATGLVQKLTYAGAADEFSFYSNDELTSLARAYFSLTNDGYTPAEAEVHIEDDDRISIHLFDIVDGHTATAAWYYINRFTATGTDLVGNDVDLTSLEGSADPTRDTAGTAEVTPAPWSPAVIQRQLLLDEDAFVGVFYLGWIDPSVNELDSEVKRILKETLAAENFEFTADMPADRFVSTDGGQELYLIIPFDGDGTVDISQGVWDESAAMITRGKLLYSSGDGEPFLLRCNVSEIIPDVIIQITDSSGGMIEWSPGLSGEDGHVLTGNMTDKKIYDFTDYYHLSGMHTGG